jgi:hypothetical protein
MPSIRSCAEVAEAASALSAPIISRGLGFVPGIVTNSNLKSWARPPGRARHVSATLSAWRSRQQSRNRNARYFFLRKIDVMGRVVFFNTPPTLAVM